MKTKVELEFPQKEILESPDAQAERNSQRLPHELIYFTADTTSLKNREDT
jgi:hypothetical protein